MFKQFEQIFAIDKNLNIPCENERDVVFGYTFFSRNVKTYVKWKMSQSMKPNRKSTFRYFENANTGHGHSPFQKKI